MNYEKKDIIRESKQLYGEINSCITDLVNARIAKNLYNEGRAIFKMEGLMVATMQHLGCVIDFLEEQEECLANNSKTSESEDERIRTRLLEYFHGFKDSAECPVFWEGLNIDNILTWLEKQKEPENTSASTMAPSCWELEQKEPKHDVTDAKSERVIKAARSVLNNWLDGTDCPDVSGAFVELEYAIRKYDGDEKQKEQKPYEPKNWPADKDNLTQEQNPSEEDEKDVAHIIRVLDDCYAYGRHDLSKTDHDNLTSTIKSLRPSWKPSEEQMDRLFSIVAALRKDYCDDMADFLASLYKQLKQLI